MELLFDQNISYKILKNLPVNYSHSTHVKIENLMNANDISIWKYAKDNKYTIVTQDSDFNDIMLFYGYPPKIIWLRSGNLSTKRIIEILNEQYVEIEKFIKNQNVGCFEILSIKK